MNAPTIPGAVEMAHRLAEREAMAEWGRPGADLVRPYLGPDDIDTAAVVARHRIVTAAALAHQPADESGDPAPVLPERRASYRACALVVISISIVVFGGSFIAHLIAMWLTP